MKQHAFIVRELTMRELRRKYARSPLGILWSVLNPLLSMAVLSLIFSGMFRRSIENYPIYYLCGYLIWQMFTAATMASISVFADNRALLLKAQLSPELFLIARVMTAFVNLLFSLIAFAAVLIVFAIPFHAGMLLIPLIFVLLLGFALGISYLLACAYVSFGDVRHLYTVVLTLWMYCSAIFYPITQLQGIARTLVAFNPLYSYIEAFRIIVLEQALPPSPLLARMLFWCLLSLGAGRICYARLRGSLMQRL